MNRIIEGCPMWTGVRSALSLVLVALLVLLLTQPEGSYGKAGPLAPAMLILVVASAGSATAILRRVHRPLWGLLLGGVAGGLAAGSLRTPQGAIIGLVAGAVVAAAPLPHGDRPGLAARREMRRR